MDSGMLTGALDTTHVQELADEPLLATGHSVYGEGPILTLFVLAVVFVFMARICDNWYIGVGLCGVLVAASFIVISWQMLADYPLHYREGDRSQTEVSASQREVWALDPRDSVSTTFDIRDASDAETLFGTLGTEFGCPDAKVEWRIDVNGEPVASGAFGEGEKRELQKVAVHSPTILSLNAARQDSAACQSKLYWKDPGLEGPGNGQFRFIFIVPEL